jgi:hypothetical protein
MAQPDCVHHWVIDPRGDGVCRCGATRKFVAHWDDVLHRRPDPLRVMTSDIQTSCFSDDAERPR